MYRKLIFLASLLWCMNVYTMPKPSEVNAAEAHGDFATAEVLLKQVIAEKPMSSRAHSDLGVLYAREGKVDFATIEANKARQLDTDALAVIESKKVLDSKASSELLYVLFGIPFVGIGIWCLYMLYTRFRKVQKAQDLEILESKGKMIKLLDMIKQLDDSALIAKTATYPDAEKVQIVKLITSLQVQVRNMLADMKDGDNITQNRLSTMKSYVDASVNQAINGLPAATILGAAGSATSLSSQEDALVRKEAKAHAATSVVADRSGESLEARVAALTSGPSIDDELAALKASK